MLITLPTFTKKKRRKKKVLLLNAITIIKKTADGIPGIQFFWRIALQLAKVEAFLM